MTHYEMSKCQPLFSSPKTGRGNEITRMELDNNTFLWLVSQYWNLAGTRKHRRSSRYQAQNGYIDNEKSSSTKTEKVKSFRKNAQSRYCKISDLQTEANLWPITSFWCSMPPPEKRNNTIKNYGSVWTFCLNNWSHKTSIRFIFIVL